MITAICIGIFALLVFLKSYYIVPHRMVYIVERFGKYHRSLQAGFNLILPFVDRVAYRHTLKEIVIDTPLQVCITRDNISVEIDGVIYLQVNDPHKASYGINDYLFATTQIAQTTMRSVIGKLNLDQTFEERERINAQIVDAADRASDPWGIKVNRYEIKDIKPPQSIKDAMEKQMRAEREKRALIAQSEGERQAVINRADGEKQKRINEAEGRAIEIARIAEATAHGIKEVAVACNCPGGSESMALRIAEQYIKEFGNLAKEGTTMIVPTNLADLSTMIATAKSVLADKPKFKEMAVKS